MQPSRSPATAKAIAVTPESTARGLLEELGHGEWDHPKTRFASSMNVSFPPQKLAEVWQSIEAETGKYRSAGEAKIVEKPSGAGVELTCAFARTEKLVRITLNELGEVSGMLVERSPAYLEKRTRDLVASANADDFEKATAAFGPVMRNALPPQKLAEAWRTVVSQAGAFQRIEHMSLEKKDEHWLSVATAQFEKTNLLVKVFYDFRDDVVGLFFAPPETSTAWNAPDYARSDAFSEVEVDVGSRPALPGTLSLPKGNGTVPAVVLIHGSGPSDRDETVGGTKAFKDIAAGLASQGIAVLRYEKRSRHSPQGIVTEKEEVLDAAHDAIELLRKTPRIDPKRVFVIGHSQGGELAPRIAKASPGLAGMIILAGSTRPMQDLLIDQFTYFASLHPDNDDIKKKLDESREFKKRVEDQKLRPTDDPRCPVGGGMTGAYFLFQRGYDPVATSRALALPTFVLQGGRDYQVTSKDFERWQVGLGQAKYAKLKLYPELNHLFVRGSGPSRPEEYALPGHVDGEVIADIAAWIRGVASR